LVVWQGCWATSSDARSSKGRDTKDNVARNFGMAPGGYRKAMRLMEHANRFGMPILTFIDTPGFGWY